MEATIQTMNQAINIDINVSINVGALKANIQRVLQAIKQCGNIGTLTLPRLYRRELRQARVLARAIDAHPKLSNLWIIGWAVVGIYIIFMYA